MALNIQYSTQYSDSFEAILTYFDKRNGSNLYSKKLIQLILQKISLLSTMPEIGRLTNYPSVRILFIEQYGIEYQIRENAILIIDIFSCKTNPDNRYFKKQ